MRAIVSGASGFLGREIVRKLVSYEIITLSRTNADLNCDLSINIPEIPEVDLVIHCAGKAHIVPKTEFEKKEFFDVNVVGTLNLLKGIDKSGNLPEAFVFISSVAVYGLDYGVLIDENTALNAIDPYGLSKIQAEKIISNWCHLHGIICTILRLPLLAGPNPPGNLKSMIIGIKKGYYVNIAGGKARKSIVLIEDVAQIIEPISKIGGIYNLTDRNHPTFSELSNYIAVQLSKSKPVNIPKWSAMLLAKIGDVLGSRFPIDSKKLNKISLDLTFDDAKAVKNFKWNPIKVLNGFKIE